MIHTLAADISDLIQDADVLHDVLQHAADRTIVPQSLPRYPEPAGPPQSFGPADDDKELTDDPYMLPEWAAGPSMLPDPLVPQAEADHADTPVLPERLVTEVKVEHADTPVLPEPLVTEVNVEHADAPADERLQKVLPQPKLRLPQPPFPPDFEETNRRWPPAPSMASSSG